MLGKIIFDLIKMPFILLPLPHFGSKCLFDLDDAFCKKKCSMLARR